MELRLVHQTVPEEWSDTIAAFMATAHMDGDEDDQSKESAAEPHAEDNDAHGPEEPSHSPQVDSAPAEPALEANDTDDMEVDDDNRDNNESDYHYGRHMITSFQSSMSNPALAGNVSSIDTPTPPSRNRSTISVLHFFDHIFPSNFSIWEAHITKLVRPTLHKCRLRGGHAQSELPQC